MKHYFQELFKKLKTLSFWLVSLCLIGLLVLPYFISFYLPELVLYPLVTLLSAAFLAMILGPAAWFKHMVGSVEYHNPTWLQSLKQSGPKATIQSAVAKAKVHKKTSMAIAVAVVGFTCFLIWHFFVPKPPPPPSVSVTLTNPARTNYFLDEQKIEQKTVASLSMSFSHAVGPLKDIGKELEKGPRIIPLIKGKWVWERDTLLRFRPDEEWKIGEKYKVVLERKMIVGHYELKELEYYFEIEGMKPNIDGIEFYEDPRNPNERKVVTTLSFNYPVEAKSLESGIKLNLEEYDKKGVSGKRDLKFSVVYDVLNYRAYIHSERVNIPKEEGKVFFKMNGITSSKGGSAYSYELLKDVRIPGVHDYFHIKSATIEVIPNEKNIPEHILVVSSSSGIAPDEVKRNIKAFQLPVWEENIKKNATPKRIQWLSKGLEEIQKTLKSSKALEMELLPSDGEFPKVFMFRIRPEVLSYLHITLNAGVKSPSGFTLQTPFSHTAQAVNFPKQLKISAEGNILSLEGEKKLSIFTVNVKKFWVTIGQLLPDQFQHLLTQSYGDMNNAYWRDEWAFSEENIAHMEQQEIEVKNFSDSNPSYTVIDFSKYLGRYLNGKKSKGVFFIKIGEEKDTKQDARIVSLTDLGVFIKRDVSGNYKIFVQSLESGRPVESALVELVGKNGLALLHKETNANGVADFAKWNKLPHEPVAFIVRKENDLTFMRLDSGGRSLNYSRFNVGGVRNDGQDDKIKTYLFSDRGTYRPGENVQLGFISKVKNWKHPLTGIPVEMVVVNSKGQKIIREALSLRENGMGEFSFDLNRDAPTGDYSVSLYNFYENDRTKNQILMGTASIKVQEFLPDRLNVRATLNKIKEVGWIEPSELLGQVNVKNLFGKAAVANRVTARMSITPASLSFSRYADYQFANIGEEVSSHEEELGEQKTNDQGDVAFKLNLAKFSKNIFRLHFFAEGFENESGRSVAAGVGALVSPFKYLVGLKKDGDLSFIQPSQERTLSLIAIDSDLNSINVDNLKLELTERKYVSVLTKKADGTYGYESILKEDVIEKKDLAIAAGGSVVNLKTDKSGDYKLRILKGDSVHGEIFYSVTGDRELSRSLNRNAELEVKMDKTDYNGGDVILLELKAPYLGKGLITIEKDKVYHHQWFNLTSKTQVLRVEVPNDIEGNAYLNVALVRDQNSREIYMSPLSYGAFGFTISKKGRSMELSLEIPEVAKAGEDYEVRYSSNHPGEVILYAINEGILQFGKYTNPNPLDYFLTKKSLDVETWQLLDLLMPENSVVQQSQHMGGGDGEAGNSQLNPFKRRLKKPVAFWSGIVKSDEEMKSWKFKLPGDFNGQLRVIAVGTGSNRMGTEVKKGFVRSDLILSPTLPTFASPGETFPVNVNIFNNMPDEEKSHQVNVAVSSSEHVKVAGKSTDIVKIEKNRDKTHTFMFQTTEQLGNADINLSASSGKSKSEIAETLSLRPSTAFNSTVVFGILRDSKIEIPITRNIYPHMAKRLLNVSSTPVSLEATLFDFLAENAYGCSEQVISKLVPYIFLKNHPLMKKSKQTAEEFFKNGLSVLRSRISGEGELLVYPDFRGHRPFVSIYFLHLLLEAKERGFVVSKDLTQDLSRYIKATLKAIANSSEKAYAIYILSQFEVVVTPFLTEMEPEIQRLLKKSDLNSLENLTLAYLAGAYATIKGQTKSYELIKKVSLKGKSSWTGYSYYSDVQGRAQVFYIMGRHFKDKLQSLKTDDYVATFEELQLQLNTLSSAYALMAIDTYKKVLEDDKGNNFKVTQVILRDNKEKTEKIDSIEKVDSSFLFSDQARKIVIERDSDFPVFYSFLLGGFDRKFPGAMENQVEVFKKYLDSKGNEIESINVGQEVTVEVSIRSKSIATFDDMILVDLLPTGFDNVLTPEGAPKSKTGVLHFSDVREDRVLAYLEATPNVSVVTYKIKPSVPGDFVLPAPLLESMYKKEIRALGKEKRIIVKKL